MHSPFIILTSVLWFIAISTAVYLAGPIWRSLLIQRLGEDFNRAITLGYSESTLIQGMRVWTFGFLGVVYVFVFVFKSWPMGLVACWLTFVLPSILLRAWIERRERLLNEQLVIAAVALSNAAKAGLSLSESIGVVARDTPSPLNKEFARIHSRYECSVDLHVAIESTVRELKLEALTLLAAALKATDKGGGNRSKAMERISHSLRENRRLEQKMETVTANSRRASNLMAAFPIGFIGVMKVMAPDQADVLFSTFWGQIVLAVILGMVYVAKRWMDRVTTLQI